MNKLTTPTPRPIQKISSFLKRIKVPAKISFIVLGIATSLWFLLRVIPKPARAGYPCMQAASPFMSGFIIYMIGLLGSAFAFKKTRQMFVKARYIFGIAFLALFLFFGLFMIVGNSRPSAADGNDVADTHPSNAPMGTGKGIFPGRVVWAFDADATDETADISDIDAGQFFINNTTQSVVDQMVSDALKQLTGQTTDNNSLTELFKYFNNQHGNGNVSYVNTEAVFIKVNLGCGGWAVQKNVWDANDLSRATWGKNYSETSPATVLAIIKKLVAFGVPQNKIWVGDPIAHIYKEYHDYWKATYPNVNYFDRNRTDAGRVLLTAESTASMNYSDGGTVMTSATTDKLYNEMNNAKYMINIGALKGHFRAGVTFTAKNHFGSQTRGDAGAGHLHPGLVETGADNGTSRSASGNYYGLYRVQVDLMGHEKLGGKTMLFMVDGLWGGPEATRIAMKFKMAPMNNDWSNSIFVSLDQVALESVCFDFLRTEMTTVNHPSTNGGADYETDRFDYPNLLHGVDDYLHQAADEDNWPAGITYDPEDNGSKIASLGVHEHWNNATDKCYSRNLGTGTGIEFVSIPANLVNGKGNKIQKMNGLSVFPNPASKFATLKFSVNQKSNVNIELFNLNGQKIQTIENKQMDKGSYSIQIDLKNVLSSGMYIIKGSINQELFSEKIQINK